MSSGRARRDTFGDFARVANGKLARRTGKVLWLELSSGRARRDTFGDFSRLANGKLERPKSKVLSLELLN